MILFVRRRLNRDIRSSVLPMNESARIQPAATASLMAQPQPTPLQSMISEPLLLWPKGAPGESGLYNRIAVLRAERGVSRQDLADALGVNYQTIGFLERGDYSPSLKLAFGLSEYFGLPVEAIFSTRPLGPLSAQVYGVRTENLGGKGHA